MNPRHSLAVFGVLFACSLWFTAPADAREPVVTDAALAEAVDAALRPGLTGEARVAVRVLDADTGEVLLATDNAGDAVIPASNMKLVTTATCLDLYGPERTLVTDFRVRGDALMIVAGGDPALGDPNLAEERGESPMAVFDRLAEALRAEGVTALPGGVYVVDGVFDAELVHPTWHPANLLHWYGAPVAGVSFNDNCVDVTFVPTELGQPAELELVPPAGGFTIRGSAATVTDADAHAPQIVKLPGEPIYELAGTVARRGGPYSKPVDDPRRFLGEATAAALSQRGIETAAEVEVLVAFPPSRPDVTASHTESTPLLDVLGRVNTNSQNMMAEAVAKLNGLAYDKAQGVDDPRGSWGSGHLAAVDFLKNAGIDTTVLVAADGSGLSRENRVSATLISDLLLHMLAEHEHSEHFVGSMAISGVRGSVRNRMKELEGRVYAKTGTIRGVSALSGYLFHDSGRVLVFSIIHNGTAGPATPYRSQQDDAVRAMAAWLDAQPALEDETDRPEPMREALDVVAAP